MRLRSLISIVFGIITIAGCSIGKSTTPAPLSIAIADSINFSGDSALFFFNVIADSADDYNIKVTRNDTIVNVTKDSTVATLRMILPEPLTTTYLKATASVVRHGITSPEITTSWNIVRSDSIPPTLHRVINLGTISH